MSLNDDDMIVIIDYGLGNIGSIYNMLRKIGASSIISREPQQIMKARKLILPGVGAFDSAMKVLSELDLISVLNYKVINQKTPILGICLGMHLFTNKSDEGKLPGFGWIDGKTVRFSLDEKLFKIPHMGWDKITIHNRSPIFNNIGEASRFYFVHSYHVSDCLDTNVIATTQYGYNFISAVQKDNIIGVQFHPEKSHKYGLNLLKNFAEMS